MIHKNIWQTIHQNLVFFSGGGGLQLVFLQCDEFLIATNSSICLTSFCRKLRNNRAKQLFFGIVRNSSSTEEAETVVFVPSTISFSSMFKSQGTLKCFSLDFINLNLVYIATMNLQLPNLSYKLTLSLSILGSSFYSVE